MLPPRRNTLRPRPLPQPRRAAQPPPRQPPIASSSRHTTHTSQLDSGEVVDEGGDGQAGKRRKTTPRRSSATPQHTPQPEVVQPFKYAVTTTTASTTNTAKPPSPPPPQPVPPAPPKSNRRPRTHTPTLPTRSGTAGLREEARQAQAQARPSSCLGTPTFLTTPLPTTNIINFTHPSTSTTNPTAKAVVADDQPLPKVHRVGMGEVYPPPPESDIRAEATFIINAAERKREEDRIKRIRSDQDLGGDNGQKEPSSPRPIVPAAGIFAGASGVSPPVHDHPWAVQSMNGTVYPRASMSHGTPGPSGGGGVPQNGNGMMAYATPITGPTPHMYDTTFAPFPYRSTVHGNGHGPGHGQDYSPGHSHGYPSHPSFDFGPSSPASSTSRRMYYSAAIHDGFPPHPPNGQPLLFRVMDEMEQYPDDSFEAQFAAVQARFRASAQHAASSVSHARGPGVSGEYPSAQAMALGRGPDDPRPPKFHSGQKPTVVLAPPGTRVRGRDRLEKAYQEGFEGLTTEIEQDCEGFLENVRVSNSDHSFRFVSAMAASTTTIQEV